MNNVKVNVLSCKIGQINSEYLALHVFNRPDKHKLLNHVCFLRTIFDNAQTLKQTSELFEELLTQQLNVLEKGERNKFRKSNLSLVNSLG